MIVLDFFYKSGGDTLKWIQILKNQKSQTGKISNSRMKISDKLSLVLAVFHVSFVFLGSFAFLDSLVSLGILVFLGSFVSLDSLVFLDSLVSLDNPVSLGNVFLATPVFHDINIYSKRLLRKSSRAFSFCL